MLLIHGLPEFLVSWRHQVDTFSKQDRVAAIDRRGYNLWDKPAGLDSDVKLLQTELSA